MQWKRRVRIVERTRASIACQIIAVNFLWNAGAERNQAERQVRRNYGNLSGIWRTTRFCFSTITIPVKRRGMLSFLRGVPFFPIVEDRGALNLLNYLSNWPFPISDAYRVRVDFAGRVASEIEPIVRDTSREIRIQDLRSRWKKKRKRAPLLHATRRVFARIRE